MNFKFGHLDLLQLRDKVCSDQVALEKWHMVVDYIVPLPADIVKIKKLLRDCELEEAVLMSLTKWYAYGDGRANLKGVLENLGLNMLAGQGGMATLGSSTNKSNIVGRPETMCLLILVSLGAVTVAFVVTGFVSPVVPPGASPPPSAPADNLERIRDVVTKDTTALQKWSLVVDGIGAPPPDELRIRGLLERGKYEDAVLESLQVWYATGDGRADLVQVLRDLGLHVLAKELGKLIPFTKYPNLDGIMIGY